MKMPLLVSLNTRHTHAGLACAMLQGFWNRVPNRPPIDRIDHDLNMGIDSLAQELILRHPPLIGFSTYIWNLMQTLTVSSVVKSAYPETFIVLGGPEVSYQADKILQMNPWIDAIVRGEGEETFEELLLRYNAGRSLAGTQGLSYRCGAEIHHEPDRPFIEDLDIIPSPFQKGLFGKGNGFTYYEASRGCPYRCTYCLSSVSGPWRSFSLDRVFSDIDWFVESDYKQVRFADRTFNQDSRRAAAIIKHILERRRYDLQFHLELKADILSQELLDLLAEAPPELFHLEIGVQSTDPNTLRAVSRAPNVTNLAEKIVKLRKATRCHIHLDLLAGLPGENFELFLQSLDEALSWEPDTVQVGWVKVLRGTALENDVKAGDLSCSPLPPYAVTKTRWLAPEEMIWIQDIGKLVEGIGNPGKFKNTLDTIVRSSFQGLPSAMYKALAHFWRDSKKPFYQFSPEAVRDALTLFIAGLGCTPYLLKKLNDLLRHEYRLTQKVPSGPTGPAPSFPRYGLPKYKLAPGYKVFWYETDPLLEIEKAEDLPNVQQAYPVIYYYETDLSKTPCTKLIDLPLPERFLLAGAAVGADLISIATAWGSAGFAPETMASWQERESKLADLGILLDPKLPKVKNSHKSKNSASEATL